MQDDHTGSDWKRMPEEYFQSPDLRLFERQRRHAEAQAELQAMAEAVGLPVYNEILLDLQLVDYDAVAKLNKTYAAHRWDLSDVPRQWMAWRVSIPILYKIRPSYDLAAFTYEGFLEELLHRYLHEHRFGRDA